MASDNLPWIEKYRPQHFNKIISHGQIIETLQNFIKNKTLPHLLFYGPPGSGKTSLINVCARELYGDQYDLMVLEINASEERGIQIVRENIQNFVSKKNVFSNDPNMFKLVILDEADAMTSDAQAMLRRVIEKYTVNTRFCLICNYIKKINIALQSRCIKFRFSSLNDKNIKIRVKEIAELEKINLMQSGLNTIIKRAKGDMRKILNILQTVSMTYNKITENNVNICLGYPTTNDIDTILVSLLNDTYNESYDIINNIIINNGYSLIDIINELYEKLVSNITSNNSDNMYDLQIINLLSQIEYNLSFCSTETLQINSLIGIFKLIKEKYNLKK